MLVILSSVHSMGKINKQWYINDFFFWGGWAEGVLLWLVNGALLWNFMEGS